MIVQGSAKVPHQELVKDVAAFLRERILCKRGGAREIVAEARCLVPSPLPL